MNYLTWQNIVVAVDENVQLQRLIARDGFSEKDALSRIQSQMPLAIKKSKAHFIINNNFSLQSTENQATEVFAYIKPNRFLTRIIQIFLISTAVLIFKYFTNK